MSTARATHSGLPIFFKYLIAVCADDQIQEALPAVLFNYHAYVCLSQLTPTPRFLPTPRFTVQRNR